MFVRGHWARGLKRIDIAPPNPSGICLCGCGGQAPIARMTNHIKGHVAGEHVRYIRGHWHRTKLTPDLWRIEDRGYGTPCWISLSAQWAGGYHRIRIHHKTMLTHRAMYEQAYGPIPKGLTIDHLCRQRSCMNPEHLEAVSIATNSRRGCNARLTMDDAREIRESPERSVALAERYGVNPSTISRIRTGTRWAEGRH